MGPIHIILQGIEVPCIECEETAVVCAICHVCIARCARIYGCYRGA